MSVLNTLSKHYPFLIVFTCGMVRGVYARTEEADAERTYIEMIMDDRCSNVTLIKTKL